ncbi:restriction endonuclease subunit S [Winogradskyella sp. Asnod2-B02-A]|uniref:restriction endonuclease subunit S n=1 Tax=Winogradskyella sp. Asnod2-B02-A TaxID=3160583 RepID=UPI00386FFE0E
MNYRVKQNLDNRLFIVNHSDLENRIDPSPYHTERQAIINKLEKTGKLHKLKNVVNNAKSITSEISENDIYIGLENIKSNTGEYIPTKIKASISSAGIFKKGQILFPKLRPYLNKVYLAEFDGICSTEFHIFDSKSKLSNEFLAIYLRSDIIVKQTKHLMTGNTLPRLQTNDIDNLPVPDVSKEIQTRIIKNYNQSFKLKQEKEKQAKELLDSIDNYLFDKLGFNVPLVDSSIENRMFQVTSKDITGSRFDAFYNQQEYYLLEEAINSAHYLNEPLRKIITGLSNGVEIRSYSDTGFRYLRVSDLSSNGIVDKNARYVNVSEVPSKIKLDYNDFLVSRSGSLGLVSVVEDEIINSILSSHIFRVSLNTSLINPYYLQAYLRSYVGQRLIFRNNNGGVIPELNQTALKSIQIILPPMELQNEIANYIIDLRDRANNLKAEAIQELKNAQQEIEKIILDNRN